MSSLQQRRTGRSNDFATTNTTGSPIVSESRLSNDSAEATMERTPRRSAAAKSSKSRKGVPLSVFAGLCCMLAVWLLIPLYMLEFGLWKKLELHDMIQSNVSGLHQKVEMLHVNTTAHEDHNPKFRKLETEVIDMRVLSATLPFDDQKGGVWVQGWDLDPKIPSPGDEPFKIFVIPHSHCDPGWIKTFDDYFRSQTSGIITSVVNSLAKDKRRKFIWAEISYFEWWWREQSPKMRNVAKKLVQNRQLEFVTGGWVQPDEANTELYAMELQLQEGHDWIRETLGKEFIPKYGWSIDPFGYSPTMAYLLQKFGFEGMLIQRVHYAVKKELASKRQLEFMWRQTWDKTGEHDIFTHLMPFYSYDLPHTCGPDPSVCCQFDFARMHGGIYGLCPWNKNPQTTTSANVHERAMLLLDQYLKKASLYRGNAVLIPIGDDFRYRTLAEADSQFTNYQAIFDYINKNVPNVQIQFGTLSDYFKSVIGTFETPILKGSFFTYSDREQDYWSGYFTSRVFDKALDRKLERVLFAAESLGATKKELQEPRRALSLFQHHDGVTGTAKTFVVNDYAERMHKAISTVQSWLQAKIAPEEGAGFGACWKSDAPRGLSQNLCADGKDVIVYNPLTFPQKCGDISVPQQSTMKVEYPCQEGQGSAGPLPSSMFKFDKNGMLTEPIQEEWMKWKVTAGGAYLFVPGTYEKYSLAESTQHEGQWVVSTRDWKRTLVQHEYSDEFGRSAIVLDFVYETNLQENNEEWFVRFTSSIQNGGVFHTDLNGFNFDTHHYREDMPLQSQVFPMPTLASIEDRKMRMSIISEHAQGTASLETGTIDIWLDRRLFKDDDRGLGQGVLDNVPTRTRLRVMLETDFPSAKEFEITPLCRRMWDELNHPLEAFGSYEKKNVTAEAGQVENPPKVGGSVYVARPLLRTEKPRNTTESDTANVVPPTPIATFGDESTPIIPFVIMVYKRVEYLKQCIDSIRKSDFNKKRIPIVISQDGNVKEVTDYIESLADEFLIHRIVHPHSCYDHPDDFPADSAGHLNKDYAGDSYKNPRTGSITCCKHHFTWLMKTVHSNLTLAGGAGASDRFFFLEEDYVVAANVYETIVTGVGLFEQVKAPEGQSSDDYVFGLLLDPANGNTRRPLRKDGFYATLFLTGPMVLSKSAIGKVIKYAREYCEFDDYNWDWSIVHLMSKFSDFPRICLVPTQPQVKHIGVDGGMHNIDPKKREQIKLVTLPTDFHPKEILSTQVEYLGDRKGFGGWGHPADHAHCLNILGSPTSS